METDSPRPHDASGVGDRSTERSAEKSFVNRSPHKRSRTVKTIFNNKSRTSTIEAPTTPARERLQAQITIQKGQLAVKEMQMKAGECTEADLQFQQKRIAALEKEL